MNLQQLKDIISEYKNKFIIEGKTPWQFKQNQNLFKKINNNYLKLFKSTMELIYLIKNYDNLENLHIFCGCGNKNNFININLGYHNYCSYRCRSNSEIPKIKMINTKLNNIDKNGLNGFQQAAIKQVKTKRNNGIYQIVVKKGKQTKKLKYNNENYNNTEKRKQTFLKRYNGTSSFNSKELREKARQTMLNDIDENGLDGIQRIKYNMLNDIDENGLNKYQRSKIKAIQTAKNNIDENGLNSYQRGAKKGYQTKLNDIDENGLNGVQRTVKKIVKTKLNNINKNGLNSYQRSVIKRYNTMKKNNSFNKSKDEEQAYNYLLQKFNKDDIERQYKSNLYPFASDFYIKSLNLYIECHFSQFHNHKPFKNSIEDLQELEKLKNKNSKYYNNVIYTWSNLDVRKLNAFKQNKLNYKIFYNIEQFNNWYLKQ